MAVNGETFPLSTITNTPNTIDDLTKEVEQLKRKLDDERAKFNDVECIYLNSIIY